MSGKRLQTELDKSQSAVSKLMAKLERRGLLSRQRDDGRWRLSHYDDFPVVPEAA
jgi:DNA-binding IclR family transcriptional regulator